MNSRSRESTAPPAASPVTTRIGRDGQPVRRYGDKVMPETIAPDIESLL